MTKGATNKPNEKVNCPSANVTVRLFSGTCLSNERHLFRRCPTGECLMSLLWVSCECLMSLSSESAFHWNGLAQFHKFASTATRWISKWNYRSPEIAFVEPAEEVQIEKKLRTSELEVEQEKLVDKKFLPSTEGKPKLTNQIDEFKGKMVLRSCGIDSKFDSKFYSLSRRQSFFSETFWKIVQEAICQLGVVFGESEIWNISFSLTNLDY